LPQNRKAMLDDKNLFTEKVLAGKRTYFIDVKENRQGHQIFKLTESRKEGGEFVRFSVIVFQEDFDKLFEAIDKAKEFMRQNPPRIPNKVFPTNQDSSFENKPTDKEEDLSF
jgi:hypothetical protein